MRRLLFATTLLVALPLAADAFPVVQFSQVGNSNTVIATDNGTTTTIKAVNATENVSQDLGGFLGNAFLNLTATSVDAAIAFGTAVAQHFSGSFSLTSLANGGGINILSGVFSDAALGAGPALGLTIGAPPDALSLTSSIIAVTQLGEPVGLGFTMTNVSPSVHIDGTTLAAFTATIAGNASANTVSTTEPTSILVLGTALLGLGCIGYRRNRAA